MVRRARGMHDVLPADEIVYKRILRVIEDMFKKYGFDPASHPAIELLKVLEAKSGEGIKTEIFRIDDNKLGLRFDLTVSLARMIAEHPEFPLPFKRYCIEKVWRREEPQYGRRREFLQADADIVGSSDMGCEAELIACVWDALNELGITGCTIYINNRKLMVQLLKNAGIADENVDDAVRILDKLDKKSEDEVAAELEEGGFSNGKELIALFKKRLDEYEKMDGCGEAVGELRALFALLDAYGITNYTFEPSLARGLGYYTGPVYEIKSSDERLGTIAAGGRYDSIIKMYAGRDVAAVGISFGIYRIAALMRKSDGRKTFTQIVLVNVHKANLNGCIAYAQLLRKAGISVRIDLMGRSMKKQLDYAAAIGASFAGIVGDKEEERNEITLKNLESGEQKTVEIGKAVEIIKAIKKD